MVYISSNAMEKEFPESPPVTTLDRDYSIWENASIQNMNLSKN